MYTIIYSNTIKIFKNDILVEERQFGELHTASFVEAKKQMRADGLKEIADFYPDRSIFESTIEPVIPPRDFQKQMIDKAVSSGIKCGIFDSPTGSGKTNTIACIIAQENKSAIVLVPTADLVIQTASRIKSVFGLQDDSDKVGMLGAGYKQLDRPILVSTWHSLQNNDIREKVLGYGYNLLISDETHRASARLLSSYISMFKSKKKFGFTATAYRSKQEQMDVIHGLLGGLVHKVDIEELYRDKFILRPNVNRVEAGYCASVDGGIKYYYQQAMRSKIWLRKLIAKELYSDKSMKYMLPDKPINEMIFNPTEDDYIILCMSALKRRNEQNKEKKKEISLKYESILNGIYKKDERAVVEGEYKAEMQAVNSVELGLAKKGIDQYTPRLNSIVELCTSVLKKDGEKAAVLFNSVAAGEYVANELKTMGYENIVLINGGEKDKSKNLLDITTGVNDNYIAISTIQMLSEGTDAPSLTKIIIGSPVFPPFTSIERAQQIIGRSVRIDPLNPSKAPQAFFVDDVATDGIAKKQKDRMWNIIESSFHPNMAISTMGDIEQAEALLFEDQEDDLWIESDMNFNIRGGF